MGKAIDKLKCGGMKKGYPDGGKVKYDTIKGKLRANEGTTTMDAVKRQQRLREYQGTLTKAFQDKFPDVPVSDLLSELNTRDPQLSRRDIPNIGKDLISKYGDLSLEADEITGILGESAKEYFEDTKTGRTAGEGDEGLQRFGFRNMTYPQFRSKNTGLYQYLDQIDKPESIAENFQEGGMTGDIKGGLGEMGLNMISDFGKSMVDIRLQELLSNHDPRESPANVLKKADTLSVAKDVGTSTLKGAAAGTSIMPGIGTAIGAGIGLLSSGVQAIFGKGEREEKREDAHNMWSSLNTSMYKDFRAKQGYEDGGMIKGQGGPKEDAIDMNAEDGSFIVPAENASVAMGLGKSILGWDDSTTAERSYGGGGIKVSDGEVFFTPEEVGVLRYHNVDLDQLAPNAQSGREMASMAKKTAPAVKSKSRSKTVSSNQSVPALGSQPKKPSGKSVSSTPPPHKRVDPNPHAVSDVGDGKGMMLKPDKKTFKKNKKASTTEVGDGRVQLLADGGSVGEYQEGGWKYDPDKGYVVSEAGDIGYDQEGNEYRRGTTGDLELSTGKTAWGKSIYAEHQPTEAPLGPDTFQISDGSKEGDEKEFKRKWYDFAPELAGSLQALGGAYGLMQAGRRPDLNVSRTLKKLSGEVRKLSQFGYEPAVLNALDTQVEKARRDTNRAITGAGGSPMEVMAKLQNTLSTTIDKKAGIVYANAAEKARKWADVLKVDTMKAGQEFEIDKINVDDYYRMQDVNAELLSAGISNIIGARQLKDEQDLVRKIGPAQPSWTSLKTR